MILWIYCEGIHQLYPGVDRQGRHSQVALEGTEDKLGMDCSLVIKNPEAVGICAAELLNQKITGGKEDREPRKYEIKVNYKF